MKWLPPLTALTALLLCVWLRASAGGPVLSDLAAAAPDVKVGIRMNRTPLSRGDFPVAPTAGDHTLAPMNEHSLSSTGVLASVSQASRESLTGFGGFKTCPKGSLIVEQGGPASALHIVVSGELQVMLRTPDELVPFGYVHEGETVGEMGFLEENAIASAAVTAVVPSVVWSISAEAFEAFLDSHPVAGTEILKAILKLVGRRARKGNERLADEIEEQS